MAVVVLMVETQTLISGYVPAVAVVVLVDQLPQQ
jgi:hypothetical protein